MERTGFAGDSLKCNAEGIEQGPLLRRSIAGAIAFWRSAAAPAGLGMTFAPFQQGQYQVRLNAGYSVGVGRADKRRWSASSAALRDMVAFSILIRGGIARLSFPKRLTAHCANAYYRFVTNARHGYRNGSGINAVTFPRIHLD